MKNLRGGCSSGGGDDDGGRASIESDTPGYDAASDLRRWEEEGKKDLVGLNAGAVIN